LGGFAPTATARSGNFTFSAAFGGLIPSLFNLQVHGFPNAAMYGPAAGFPYGFHSFHGGHPRGYHRHQGQGQQDYYLKRLLLFIGFCVLLALVWQ
jgi:E3 ubiquitin-protein ligase RNF5